MEGKPDENVLKNIKITDEHIRRLFELLERNQVVILVSPTGTGKSTYILSKLIDPPKGLEKFAKRLIRQGQVVQTQPLTSATERIPNTVSRRILGESGAHEFGSIGLRHRGMEKYGRHNLAVVVTDGSLINWIRDGRLDQYSLVMVDEAHKRTLNVDTILMLLKYMSKLYPHLKLIISSATIDPKVFLEAFKKEGISADVLDLRKEFREEINYFVHWWKGGPIENCGCWLCQRLRKLRKGEKFYLYQQEPPSSDLEELSEVTAKFVVEILKNLKEGEGVLVFLPGAMWIERTKELIDHWKREIDPRDEIETIPVYRALGARKVEENFNKKGKRGRVLITTDIAETSHTFDDIVYVVDSGYIREVQWDPETLTSHLPVTRHSKAGCKQRWGRAGRVKKGYVYCLYREDQLDKEFTTPEIFRERLDNIVLNLKAAGIREISPSLLIGELAGEKIHQELQRSLSALKEESLLDEEGNVTEKGLETFRFPNLTPEEKALLDLADEQNCFLEMLIAILMMRDEEGIPRTGANLYSERGLLIWNPNWSAKTKMRVWKIYEGLKAGCRDDLDFVMKLAYCFSRAEKMGIGRKWAEWHFVNYEVLREIYEKVLLDEESVRREIKDLERRVKFAKNEVLKRALERSLSEKKEMLKGLKKEEILEKYREKAEERRMRDIDLDMIERVRSIFATILSEREFEIVGGSYRLKDGKGGIISRHSVGSWSDGEKGILVAATKEEVIENGRPVVKPSASFIVKFPNAPHPMIKEYLLVDQIFPIGNIVPIEERNGRIFLRATEALRRIKAFSPRPFIISYKEPESSKKKETIYFDERLMIGLNEKERAELDIKLEERLLEGKWIGKEKPEFELAVVLGWTEQNGVPVPLLALPSDGEIPENPEELLAKKIKAIKKVGDKLKVKIEKVFRDPIGEDGWIEAEIVEPGLEGFKIAIELSDMSLHPKGYGLEVIEGEESNLLIEGFDEEGLPKLSNIQNIIDDLDAIRSEPLIKEIWSLAKRREEKFDDLFNLVEKSLEYLRQRKKILGEW